MSSRSFDLRNTAFSAISPTGTKGDSSNTKNFTPTQLHSDSKLHGERSVQVTELLSPWNYLTLRFYPSFQVLNSLPQVVSLT